MDGRKNGPHPFTVKAEEGGAIIVENMVDEFSKGLSDIFHASVVVQVVIFNIGHHGNVVSKFQKGTVAFIGFGNNIVPFAADGVPMNVIRRCSQNNGGVHAGFIKNLSQHAGGRGFSMSTGYGDAFSCHKEGRQHVGTMENGNPLLFCFQKLRIVFGNGGGNHYAPFPLHMGSVVADVNGGAPFPEICKHGGIGHVGTGNGISLFQKDFSQGTHPHAADTDKMKICIFVKIHLICSLFQPVRGPDGQCPCRHEFCQARRRHRTWSAG